MAVQSSSSVGRSAQAATCIRFSPTLTVESVQVTVLQTGHIQKCAISRARHGADVVSRSSDLESK